MGGRAYANDTIYVVSNSSAATTNFNARPTACIAVALSASDGAIKWQTPFPTTGMFGGVGYANGAVFFSTVDGAIHALDAGHGHELWTDTLGPKAASGVSIADGMAFAGTGWEWANVPPGSLVAYGLP
jgi:outer membrane protein assembly factor BamB